MQIFWHGYTSVRIESKNGEAASTLVTDPFENETSIRFPRTIEADLLVLSHQDRKRFNVGAVQGAPFIISDPGEYEAKGVFVRGIQDSLVEEGRERPVIYRITTEDMTLAFLGHIARKPTDAELEEMERIDILLLPVGGGDGLDAKTANELITLIEPRIVIPLGFAIPGLKQHLGSIDEFCKQLGVYKREHMNRLKIQKKDLPAEDTLVAVLDRA